VACALLAQISGAIDEEASVNTTPSFEVPSAVRDLAEKSINQARQAFDSFISAARGTAELVELSAVSDVLIVQIIPT